MEDITIERTAIRLTQKYGKMALPKAVEVAKYYLEAGDDEAGKRWVSIGYAVKKLQKVQSIGEIVSSIAEESEEDKIPEELY
jgi:hypothetical protein